MTNAQYAAFLTAKATSSDPYGLWNSDMSGYVEGGHQPCGQRALHVHVQVGHGKHASG